MITDHGDRMPEAELDYFMDVHLNPSVEPTADGRHRRSVEPTW